MVEEETPVVADPCTFRCTRLFCPRAAWFRLVCFGSVPCNARPHMARVVQAYLEQEDIDVMEWPEGSPDLKPIEHLWDILQRRVSWRQNPPATVQALTEALREEWNGINQVSVHHLIRSMHRRYRECIHSRGSHTSY